MKRVVSISLGSDRRDHKTTAIIGGESVEIARIGTNGDLRLFRELLHLYDGKADAIGLGGLDRFLWANGKRYEFRAVRALVNGLTTPIVDGSGLKNSLERRAVEQLAADNTVDFARQKTLIVCGVDRFGLSEAIADQGGAVRWGDLPFTMDIPYPIRSRRVHSFLARLILPIVTQLPPTLFYPTGAAQNRITPKWGSLYSWADIIAGDFLLIRRYLPLPNNLPLTEKTVLTNSTTDDDVRELTLRGADRLITTTPIFAGRTFGTNAMEAVLVALNGGILSAEDYTRWNSELGWGATVRRLAADT